MQPKTTITEIHDDGPKWRAVAVLIAGLVVALAVVISVWLFFVYLRLDERAALAISEIRQVNEVTRSYKVMFWIVFWLALALVVSVSALSISVVFTARAYQIARDVFEERRLIAYAHSPPSLPNKRPGQLPKAQPESLGQVPAKEHDRSEFSRYQIDLQDSSARVGTRSQDH